MHLNVLTGKNNHWIVRNYGSRSGLLRSFWHRLLYHLGRYHNYRKVDWSSVERLVFVCKGNICRSAYAEAVARSIGIDAISCGLDTVENSPANPDAESNAKSLGYDLTDHRTTPVMYLVLRNTDLLIAMEPWQASFLEESLARKHHKTLLGLWSKPVLPYLQDPYGASPLYFEKCFKYIEKSVHDIAKKIQK